MILRKIEINDNPKIKEIIHSVMIEHGASGEGFSLHDSEVNNMFASYTRPKTIYFVVENEGIVSGGAGIGPLEGESSNVCELKKMYFKKEIRGNGLGQKLLEKCLDEARLNNYDLCYIETFSSMNKASKLYLKNGFKRINQPMGNTGHHACNIWLIKKL